MNQLQMLKTALIAYVNSVKEVWSVVAHPLSIFSKRKGTVKDYRIYGNSVQDGTPTHEEPIEVQSVGELVTEGKYAEKYKVPVTVRGKNFINKDNITITPRNRRFYEKNGDLITIQGNEGASQYASSGGTLALEFPKTLPSGTYTFSIYVTLLEEGIWGTGMRIYANNSYLFSYSSNTVGLRKKIKGTYSAENGFSSLVIRLNGCKWLIEVDTLQVENGDTATDYEPYVEPQTVNIYLDEPLRKVVYPAQGWTFADLIEFERKKAIRNVYKEYITSVRNKSSNNGTTSVFFSDITKKPWFETNRGVCISDKFIQHRAVYANLKNTDGYIQPYITSSKENAVAYTFKGTDATLTVQEAQELIGDGFEVCYALGKPIEVDIDLPKLPQFKGTTIYEVQTEVPPSGIEVCYIA